MAPHLRTVHPDLMLSQLANAIEAQSGTSHALHVHASTTEAFGYGENERFADLVGGCSPDSYVFRLDERLSRRRRRRRFCEALDLLELLELLRLQRLGELFVELLDELLLDLLLDTEDSLRDLFPLFSLSTA